MVKLLRQYIRTLIKESNDPVIDNLNTMIDEAEDSVDQDETWNTIYELIDSMYDYADMPPDLKVWGAMDCENGEILASGLTQYEALAWRHPEYVPCTPDGQPVDEPVLYPEDTNYCFCSVART